MISVEFKDFLPWLENKFATKYNIEFDELTHNFTIFSNLTEQIIFLYNRIKEKLNESEHENEEADMNTIIDRSILLLDKINNNFPICFDSHFCEEYIEVFESNIKLLCTYYHSLSHFEFINKTAFFEKTTIVEGINKLHDLYLKIKESFSNECPLYEILFHIWEHKEMFKNKAILIEEKEKAIKERGSAFLKCFETQAFKFYTQFGEKMLLEDEDNEAKKSLLSAYFQLNYQALSTQAHLECLVESSVQICDELKNKKKTNSLNLQDACNNFNKTLSTLLRPVLSYKTLKKVKVEEFCKSIDCLLKEKDLKQERNEISKLINLLVEISKELDKIEQSGVLSTITEYKENHMPNSGREFIAAMLDYQEDLNRIYRLHEEQKHFLHLAQLAVFEEFNLKIDIAFE